MRQGAPALATLAFGLATVAFLLATVYLVHEQVRVNAELCEHVVNNREADRTQWITLDRLLSQSTSDPERRAAYHALVEGVLRPIPALQCIDDKPVPIEEG